MDRALGIVFCAALALAALVTKPHADSWNERSRLATVDALVAHHTFAIEDSPFAARTKDKYRYGGHTYSDKPPALALQAALVAEALKPLGITLERTPGRAIYWITLLSVGVWFALGCAYAYAFPRALGFGAGASALAAALTGVGTLALPYASVLANHVPAGAAALGGIYHLFRARENPWHAAAAGAFLALAYAFDAAAIVFALSALVMLWGAPPRRWVIFGVACVPLIAAQLAFNAHVSSGLGPPAINQESWNDPLSPFYRGANQSVFLFSSPLDYVRYALYLLVGDKGLIAYTPLVLLCAFGLARMWRGAGPERRPALAIVLACAAYFVLMLAFTDDYRALNYGERRYVDLFFVLGVGIAPALAALQRGAGALAARFAAAWSIAAAMLGTLAPFGEARGVGGAAYALQEFARLTHRAPVQAALDVLAVVLMIFLVQRFWSRAAAPTSGSGRLAASPQS
jgi:hypothetical protein